MEKNLLIDENYDSYQSFFDHTWAQGIDQLVTGTPLAVVVFDLCAAWKAAANTHRLPWLMFQLFRSFSVKFLHARASIGSFYVGALTQRLPTEMGGLRHMQRKQLGDLLQRIYEDVRNHPDQAVGEFVLDKLWDQIVPDFEFHASLWASQRLCFGAIYYAYEDFLVRTYRVIAAQPDYRMNNAKQFHTEFGKVFTPELRDFCFDGEINVARLVRNALAHSGGRETAELSKEKHQYHIEGGEIQIVPSNTTALFNLLKERATKVTTESVARLPKV
jgi:hypothetical protein